MSPLLTIAIPTFQRADYLAKTLSHLRADLQGMAAGLVEVIVSDNASQDSTPAVVAAALNAGLPLRAVRNAQNIGSDANIAQAFDLATGKYVLILGDDDIPMPGALDRLLRRLAEGEWGVVFLRPYGYDEDLAAESPGEQGDDQPFANADSYLVALGAHVTFISSLVLNKGLLVGVSAQNFVGGNLVQVHLALSAMVAARQNLFSTRYSVACKRNNSGGYLFARVFVAELSRILDSFAGRGISASGIRRFETKLLVSYHPTYALRARRTGKQLAETLALFRARFNHRWLFWLWVAPTLTLPMPLATGWGYFTIAVGRVLHGDFRRGLAFVRSAVTRRRT